MYIKSSTSYHKGLVLERALRCCCSTDCPTEQCSAWGHTGPPEQPAHQHLPESPVPVKMASTFQSQCRGVLDCPMSLTYSVLHPLCATCGQLEQWQMRNLVTLVLPAALISWDWWFHHTETQDAAGCSSVLRCLHYGQNYCTRDLIEWQGLSFWQTPFLPHPVWAVRSHPVDAVLTAEDLCQVISAKP